MDFIVSSLTLICNMRLTGPLLAFVMVFLNVDRRPEELPGSKMLCWTLYDHIAFFAI